MSNIQVDSNLICSLQVAAVLVVYCFIVTVTAGCSACFKFSTPLALLTASPQFLSQEIYKDILKCVKSIFDLRSG